MDGIFCETTDDEIRQNYKEGAAPGYKKKDVIPIRFIKKEEIGLNNIDDIIARYPQFYKQI